LNNRERQKEIILQLKQIRHDRELSVQDVYFMVKDAGFSTSESSVRRVFAEGSEEQNFRYQDTIQPIAQVLIGVKEEGEPLNAAEADALKQIALLKESMITDLQTENAQLLARVQKLEGDFERTVKEYETRIEEYRENLRRARARVDKLDEQINRKDDYIDRVAKKAGI